MTESSLALVARALSRDHSRVPRRESLHPLVASHRVEGWKQVEPWFQPMRELQSSLERDAFSGSHDPQERVQWKPLLPREGTELCSCCRLAGDEVQTLAARELGRRLRAAIFVLHSWPSSNRSGVRPREAQPEAAGAAGRTNREDPGHGAPCHARNTEVRQRRSTSLQWPAPASLSPSMQEL